MRKRFLRRRAKWWARPENPIGGAEQPTKRRAALSFWLADPPRRIHQMGRNGAGIEPSERSREEVHKCRLQVSSALKGSEQAARFWVAPYFDDWDSHTNCASDGIRSLQGLARLRLRLVENLGGQDASKAGKGELAGPRCETRHSRIS